MPLPPSPHYFNEQLVLSRDFFLLTTLMNNTLPFNTAAGTPALPKVLRAIRCLADGTIQVQSLGGGVVSLPMKAGEVHAEGYVVAVNVPNDTAFVGYA